MNFTDTMASVELVPAANQVPLLVGETGIGKTSLEAQRSRESHDWELVTIDGNLLKVRAGRNRRFAYGGNCILIKIMGAVKEIKDHRVCAVHHTLGTCVTSC